MVAVTMADGPSWTYPCLNDQRSTFHQHTCRGRTVWRIQTTTRIGSPFPDEQIPQLLSQSISEAANTISEAANTIHLSRSADHYDL